MSPSPGGLRRARAVGRALAGTLGTLALAGCNTVPTGPTALSSPQLIPQRFPATANVETGATAPAPVLGPLLAWDQFFTDLPLQGLIRLALEHNRDLRLAALNVEQSRAQAAIREADLWPTVNAGVSGNRAPTNAGGVSTTVIGGLASTAYELDLFGRVRQQAAAAQAQLQASEFLQSAARASLIAAVAAAYANLQADEALLRITDETVRGRQDSLQIVQGRLKAGAASALEVAQADSLLQAARAARSQVQRQKSLDESTLQLLLGRPTPPGRPDSAPYSTSSGVQALLEGLTSAAGAAEADHLVGLPLLRAGLPSEVLARRPDLRAAEAQLRAAQANVEAARRAYFPRISLTASYGQASKELSALFAGGNWVWGVAPSVLAPIFDAGRLRAGVQQAQAAQQSALAQYEKAVQVAFKEANDALASQALLLDQLKALRLQVRAETQRVGLAQARWQLGASAYVEVLDAQRSLYSAQSALVQTAALALVNQATLYKVLGGG
ncbi:MAG: efflux transporter outer membrane subunit [Betaproteobacteria bacterium]|nr:efflux transporter outer membrane subunit [Betaproteobacteria bacterium]